MVWRRTGTTAAAVLAVFLLVVLVSPHAATAVGSKTYTFAVVPQFPALEIERDWMPLLRRLSELLGHTLSLKFYKSIPDFEQEFIEGRPDFAFMNPYHAVMAKSAAGYVPLIRDGEHPLVGILVVKKDGPVRSAQDLRGTVIAFPSPNAFAASLYMRYLLTEHEKITFTPKYVGTHSNVYRHVALGLAAAGGGALRTLQKEAPELRDQLRVMYETPGAAAHPVCAHPRVPAAVREAVAAAILHLAQDKEGRALLRAVRIERPVPAVYERDYAPLERLGLERYIIKGRD